MSAERDPQTVTGPEPVRRTYNDDSYGSEEMTGQPDGSENVGANYSPGAVRTGGNLTFAIVAVVAFLILVALYVVVVAR